MDSLPKLLVVDDDAEIRKQLKWALSSEYVVLETENRPTAVAVTRAEKRAVVMAERPRVTPADLELTGYVTESESLTLREIRESMEKDIIQRSLLRQNCNISRAAQELAVSRPTLYDMMKKYGLEKPQSRKM